MFGYSLEATQQGASDEYPEHVFIEEWNKKYFLDIPFTYSY